MRTTTVTKLLDAVAATTTSKDYYVGDAEKICFLITCANRTSGNGVFIFAGGMTENLATTVPTTVALSVITTNVANTNGQTILRTTGATLAANGSSLLWLDLKEFPVEFLNCTVTRTTDGNYSCWMLKVIK